MNLPSKIGLTYLVLILQTTLASNLVIQGAIPNFVLILVIMLSFSSDYIQSISLGFWIGFGLDALSPANFGANTLTMTLMAYATFQTNQKLFINDVLSRILLMCGAIIIYHFVFLFVLCRTELIRFPVLLFSQGLPAILYTSMIGIITILLVFYRKKHA